MTEAEEKAFNEMSGMTEQPDIVENDNPNIDDIIAMGQQEAPVEDKPKKKKKKNEGKDEFVTKILAIEEQHIDEYKDPEKKEKRYKKLRRIKLEYLEEYLKLVSEDPANIDITLCEMNAGNKFSKPVPIVNQEPVESISTAKPNKMKEKVVNEMVEDNEGNEMVEGGEEMIECNQVNQDEIIEDMAMGLREADRAAAYFGEALVENLLPHYAKYTKNYGVNHYNNTENKLRTYKRIVLDNPDDELIKATKSIYVQLGLIHASTFMKTIAEYEKKV